MHHARSEGAMTRHCDAEPLAWSRSNAVSAANGEVNPASGSEVGVEGAGAPTRGVDGSEVGVDDAGAPTRGVDGPFEWPPSAKTRPPPAASATTATAAMTIQIGPRIVDFVFDMAWPDGWSCQPPGGRGGAATVWLKRLSCTESGGVGADGGGAHKGGESFGKDWLDEPSGGAGGVKADRGGADKGGESFRKDPVDEPSGGAGTATRPSSLGSAGESLPGSAGAKAECSEEPFT